MYIHLRILEIISTHLQDGKYFKGNSAFLEYNFINTIIILGLKEAMKNLKKVYYTKL